MLKRILIFSLFLISSLNLSAKYSLDKKVDLLFEVLPKMDSDRMKSELKAYVLYLHKFDKFPDKKRVKKIFKETKKKYLHSYYLYSFFPQLLTKGTFNCVTGSALFAILFDELKIPYSVIEVPQHVYLIAFPQSYRIGVESTDFKDGIYNWTEYNKLDAVNYLLQIDEVSQNEVQLKGTDAIVDEYFYSNSEHDFDGLVGMHFFNRALYLNEKKKFDDALYFLRRADDFYINKSHSYMEGAILSNLIQETEYDDIKIVTYLCQYYSLVDKKSQRQRVESTFGYVISGALITRHDYEFIDSSMYLVDSIVLDDIKRNTLMAEIFSVRCMYHYNRGQYDKALELAEEGYAMNPEDKAFQDLIASSIINSLIASEPDDAELFDIIVSYEEKYPFLKESPQFLNFVVSFYSIAITDAFIFNEYVRGFIFVDKLLLYIEHPDINKELTYPFIGEAFGSIASYYFRTKKYEDANQWINKALIYDPESESLLNKQNYILKKM